MEKLKHPKVVALGEIGLDYHWMTAPKEVQEQVFRRQIQLSKDLDLPFVVHTRDALEDTYEIIKSEGVGPRGGIMHSFSGTLEWAEKFVDLGMTISFSGVVTFKKATDIQEAARELPLDKIFGRDRCALLGTRSQAWSRKQDSLHALCSGLYCRLTWSDDRRNSCCDKCKCRTNLWIGT